MRWHKDNPRVHGLMSHPSDGEAWKHLDEEYPSFAAEPRNVRLGLCTDGFSPFGKTGRQYSCWPVILTPYNLPPELYMKKPFMFLSLIIPGPKNPKGNLDVYLQPLIEELKQLWEVGLPTYDISQKQNFQLKAALLWTISDFPAYGMLLGWTTAGRLACPYCMENTKAFTLKNGGKQNRVENVSPPPRMSGEDIWNRVSLFPKTVEKIRGDGNEPEGYGEFHHWTKQSVFWELPYWSKLLIRHNLDVMHIEKKVFDNVFHTVMDVKGKTKDNVKARRDLGEYCKRRKLEAQDVVNSKGEKRTLKPNAPFVFPKEKRKLIYEWVKKLKFPDGYASNLGRRVDLKECKLFEEVDSKVKDLGLGAHAESELNNNPDLPEMFSSTYGHSSSEGQLGYLVEKDYKVAHRYVLSNCETLQQYESLFEEQMIRGHRCQSSYEVWIKYEDKYPDWFKDYVLEKGIKNDIVCSLAFGPLTRVRKFNHYHINGYHFHTYSHGKNKSTMNYGICVKSVQGSDYYGILQEIIELTYVGARKRYTTVLFKCEWFDVGPGIRIHDKYNLVEVNHSKRYPKYDPFVLAYQAEQVYYAPCPSSSSNERNQWWFVFNIKARGVIDAPVEPNAFQVVSIENPPLLSEFEVGEEEAQELSL
ncbi:uncharacterized protein LOC110695577 [Chenopodium quinoa]|uniref:uncharacterized protein LOC110695577 n=1 Tax=Chenopodium quinoa TaxID=63459 RepID=UPI000B78682C|nr:uncharacterized protein LOC110695577 [Chenopodium quinoa]